MSKAIVIGHRGASGYAPEHTLASYELAIEQGADYIEPDLVMTRDGVLIARHENEIGGTTDVAQHSEFAGRKTAKVIDGVTVEGWFTEDFTLAELKTLRARERIPGLRPANTRLDDQLEVPTFDEVLALAQRASAERTDGRRIGVYPETKHPSYFDTLGHSMDESLLAALRRFGYTRRGSPVYIQSFEVGNLKRIRKLTRLPLVQLLEAEGAPFDLRSGGESRSYADLLTPAGLAEVATYANAIGPNKNLVIPRNADQSLGTPTKLVANAHAAQLAVHPWTFRIENQFLPANFRSSENVSAPGRLDEEIRAFLAAGIDGFFTDNPDVGVLARDAAPRSG